MHHCWGGGEDLGVNPWKEGEIGENVFLKLILLLIILLLILIILIVLFISTSWVCFAHDSDSSHPYLNS